MIRKESEIFWPCGLAQEASLLQEHNDANTIHVHAIGGSMTESA